MTSHEPWIIKRLMPGGTPVHSLDCLVGDHWEVRSNSLSHLVEIRDNRDDVDSIFIPLEAIEELISGLNRVLNWKSGS